MLLQLPLYLQLAPALCRLHDWIVVLVGLPLWCLCACVVMVVCGYCGNCGYALWWLCGVTVVYMVCVCAGWVLCFCCASVGVVLVCLSFCGVRCGVWCVFLWWCVVFVVGWLCCCVGVYLSCGRLFCLQILTAIVAQHYLLGM